MSQAQNKDGMLQYRKNSYAFMASPATTGLHHQFLLWSYFSNYLSVPISLLFLMDVSSHPYAVYIRCYPKLSKAYQPVISMASSIGTAYH